MSGVHDLEPNVGCVFRDNEVEVMTPTGRGARMSASPELAKAVEEVIDGLATNARVWSEMETTLRSLERELGHLRPDARRLEAIKRLRSVPSYQLGTLMEWDTKYLAKRFKRYGREYAEAEGITHGAFLAVGVPPEFLSAAGIEPE